MSYLKLEMKYKSKVNRCINCIQVALHLQLAYIQACFDVERETAEKQMEAEQLATRERIGQEIKDKILQLQEETVASELNEGNI